MMKNAILEIPREDAIELPEGSYFIGDIIGCTVRENGKDILGVVTDVLQQEVMMFMKLKIRTGRCYIFRLLEMLLLR